MAKIEFYICDRCKETISYHLFTRVSGRIRKYRIFGFGPYDYSNVKYELCRKCSDELDKFLRGKEVSKDEN